MNTFTAPLLVLLMLAASWTARGQVSQLGHVDVLQDGTFIGRVGRLNFPSASAAISATGNTATVTITSGSNYVTASTLGAPTLNRYSILESNAVPWRIGGFGDSLGDDVPAEWGADFGRALGFNGGYLTSFTNTLFAPLTYTHSGFTTIPLPDTNWFAIHYTLGVGGASADVTFDSAGRYLPADTFRVAMVHSTNGGTYKLQVATNGGAFTDITGTLSALTANPTGVVVNFSTNLGEWKLRVVNVSGTNVLIGGGLWASNRGGFSPSHLWSFGGTLADVTNVSTNITVPVLASLGLTEFQWHALDTASLLTNALPIFVRTLGMAGLAATNCDGLFIGVNKVTDNSTRYDLGNLFVKNYVVPRGYSYADTEGLGSTNDLVRRQWVTSGDCIHLNTLGIYYLANLMWRDGGIFQRDNAEFGSLLGNRPCLVIYAPYQGVSNLFEIKNYGGTNVLAVSKDGYLSVGDRLTGTYMLDVLGNLILGRTNFSTTLGFARLNSSSSLAHQILFDALNANTATITYERDSGRFTFNSGVGIDMNIDADANQTGNAFTINKDAPNTTNAVNLFSVRENGGVSFTAGQTLTNAFVGGTIYYSDLLYTNLNGVPGTLTNLATYSLPGHVLTNRGDRIVATWGGRMANALENTNNFKILFGGTTVLDTGLQISSNTTWTARMVVTRGSAVSTEHVEARFEWGPGGAVPFAFTNVNAELTVDAGIAATIALQGSAQRVGAHTNNSFVVEYKPGPK